jgi:F420-dependent oxidoreductase-like protein
MRIGLGGGAATVERLVEQAVAAERDGFASMWYPSPVLGDPMAAIARAGQATTSIELGTGVLVTYAAHPLLTAARAGATAAAMGRPGLVLGLGPSHAATVEGIYGLSYEGVGRHTEEYAQIVTAVLRGEPVHHDGEAFRVHAPAPVASPVPVPVLLGALAPRMLRVAGELTDGTVTWFANAVALESHVVPRISAAASGAGRPAPRVVAALPVAVHDDVDEARAECAQVYRAYDELPNYQRILAIGGVDHPAEACVVGDEDAVADQLRALFRAGATDVWAAIMPVGGDRAGSRARTRALLRDLLDER